MRSEISARLDRDIVRLALPALGALAADPLVSMVDTVFVGRLGVVPLAALGVNTSVFALSFVVFNFLAYGTTPMVARAVGRGDRVGAGNVVQQALLVAVVVGSIATLFLEALAVPIVTVMGAGTDLRDPALSYLRIRALAGPAVLFVTAGHGAFRGYQDTRTPLLVTLGINAVNLVLDPLFIFGFGWGLQGAALATLLAQWVGAMGFLHLLLVGRRRELGIEYRVPRLSEIRPFLRIGGELAIRTLALIGTMTLATAIATRVGTVQVAAHQVAQPGHEIVADVARLLKKFNEQHVAGVILDLRRNGGGSLEEAIKLTGLFIKEGPVVQVRASDNTLLVREDTDSGVVYDGPLIVLTSRFSASTRICGSV